MRDRKAVAAALRGLGLASYMAAEVGDARLRVETAFVLSSGVTDRLGQARALQALVPILLAADDYGAAVDAFGALDEFGKQTSAQVPPFLNRPLQEAAGVLTQRLGVDNVRLRRAQVAQLCVEAGELDLRGGFSPPSEPPSLAAVVGSILGST